jgi:glycosyltransferase involved in cell wall biosynthesis
MEAENTAKKPKISIITPSLNQGDYIEQAIRSVIDQHYDNFEHIIIDGGSVDKTHSVAQQYPHLRWVAEPKLGFIERMNEGITLATGDIVGYLSTDDYYLPDCFHTVIEHFVSHPRTDIVYGDLRWVDQTGDILQYRRELEFDLFMLKYLHILYVSVVTAFFRRKVFNDNNFLDTRYGYCGDYELLLRLALQGYRFAHLNRFLADFRWHATSLSTTAGGRWRDEHRQALLSNDPFLLALPAPMRGGAKTLLTGAARTKRIILKATKGYYFHQWPRTRLWRILRWPRGVQRPEAERVRPPQTLS